MVCNFYSQIKGVLPLSQSAISKIINQSAKILRQKLNFELSVIVVGDKEIQRLNKAFRHKDKITDVLSFSAREGLPIMPQPEIKRYLGEIVISLPQIKRQAPKFDQSTKKEFSLMLVHGFLHLLGYDDKILKGAKQMADIQNKIINKIYG